MFNEIIQLMDGIKDLVVNNLGVTIPSATTVGATAYAVIKARLSSRQAKVITEKDSTIATLQNKLESSINSGFEKVNQRMNAMEVKQAQDTATLGEALNLMGQNSRAAGPETKAKLKNLTNSLSGMTKDKISRVNLETQELLKKIEIPKEVSIIKDKINKAGQSILDKYLSEDVVKDGE